MTKKPATASYWAFAFDSRGQVQVWMWNCETCPAFGQAGSEPDAIRDMNGHVESEHPDRPYTATPIPE